MRRCLTVCLAAVELVHRVSKSLTGLYAFTFTDQAKKEKKKRGGGGNRTTD